MEPETWAICDNIAEGMKDPLSGKRRNMLSASFGIAFPTNNSVQRLPSRESGEAIVIAIIYKMACCIIAA